LRTLTPVTPEDYMCRGHAVTVFGEVELALSDLDTAIAMRDSPIAHAFRAFATAGLVREREDLKLIERAIDDIQQAKFRLRDNSFVRFMSALVYFGAAGLYDEIGQTEKRKAALAELKEDVDVLKNMPVCEYIHTCVIYYELVGDDEAALKLLEPTVTREG